jgi:type I restriction enzyme M protein
MLREFKLEDIDPVGDLKNKVLHIINTFRHYYIDGEIYPSVLFLLSLQKDGILDDLILSKTENLFLDIAYQINNSKEDSKEIYKSLIEVYEPFLSNSKSEVLNDAIIHLRELNQLILKGHFTIIFEDLLYQLSRAQGKFGGESLMPREVCRFMIGLAKLPKKAKIYNPFAGLASFGVFLDKN